MADDVKQKEKCDKCVAFEKRILITGGAGFM